MQQREVHMLGQGRTPVTRHTETTVRQLAAEAATRALGDADAGEVDAIYVGNMLGSRLSNQCHLGVALTTDLELTGIEASTVEVASASGAGAVRAGFVAVASGLVRRALVVGVERMSHVSLEQATAALATAADFSESADGETFRSLNACLMRTYLDRYDLPADALAPLSVLAHQNARGNPMAVFRKDVDEAMYHHSRVVSDPVRLYDASPICDGAAAVVLGTAKQAAARSETTHLQASASSTDALAVAARPDPLELAAARRSVDRALAQANLRREDIDLFESHDAYTIMAALSLEAAGFCPPGEAAFQAAAGAFCRDGALPIATMGGLKARGHPIGATGVYQLAEAHLQVTGRAGACQVPGAQVAMTQNLGGTAATVLTHIVSS